MACVRACVQELNLLGICNCLSRGAPSLSAGGSRGADPEAGPERLPAALDEVGAELVRAGMKISLYTYTFRSSCCCSVCAFSQKGLFSLNAEYIL